MENLKERFSIKWLEVKKPEVKQPENYSKKPDGSPKSDFPLCFIVCGNERYVFGYDKNNHFMKVEQEPTKSWAWSMEDAKDLRGKRCYICNREWTSDPDDLANQICVEHPDWEPDPNEKEKSIRVHPGEYAHETCYIGHLSLVDKAIIKHAICKARRATGCRLAYSICKSPCEYSGGFDTDWFVLRFPDSEPLSQIKFGSRRSVWVVEMTTNGKFVIPDTYPGRHPLFWLKETEDVTKDFSDQRIMLHAHSEEKVNQYVEAMVRIIEKPEKNEDTSVPAKPMVQGP